ncbi:alpha-D-ribose 1-methylphosphonate 5-triphosphate diphosphatase [Telmatospirillum sp.]|uniref:alpha-D-ribose 1-methylphosphonate 5-triphosphate diphosphatase n=1 Tax=Telmatospirillum sp. TaxID=2079197 RepID=UPI002851EE13|nr:alpha-D-ribose 1-methylphosphonate 5-triphosphate diphosphatase [Telmatospirillum sp.]MDR3440873.1 alpha-D-ribose 1-methylphosphonate 5-triphosphate diphosphatase [Telmatospirillum sp.]
MCDEMILTNARVVCRDRIIGEGTVVVRDGTIADVDEGRSQLASAIDLDGDYLLPGLVEMHTDNIEKHFMPRPGVLWPSSLAAVLSHDLQVAGAGITTVLDAIALGESKDKAERRAILKLSIPAITQARADKLTKADHFLHLRCEVAHPDLMDMFAPYVDNPLVKLISVMDHTPGQRQWWDLGKYVQYNKGEHWSEAELAERVRHLRELQDEHAPRHRRAIAIACRERGIPLASHDDATEDHIRESIDDGASIAEFPLTLDAADLARRNGMKTIMGAPNIVRGQSHSGNMSALDCAAAGQLDGLSSDYVPASLMFAAFLLAEKIALPLTEAVATVSDNIARMVGLADRGRIEAGLRADLVWVMDRQHCPVIRQVWSAGERVI